ncbi:MAG: helix-turn-helix domain-containing protein [Candidatus Aenigmarchaeota archaeon]|nr:helix-turn-helix domain-containing protein [Candidatus Aenigmarchaeota archaeon]
MSRNSTSNENLEERILNLLSKKIMSTSQLAKELGMRRDVAAGYLEALKNQGKLNFFKVGKSHVYTTSERWKND